MAQAGRYTLAVTYPYPVTAEVIRLVTSYLGCVISLAFVSGLWVACGTTTSPATPVSPAGPSAMVALPSATPISTAVSHLPAGTATRNPTAVFEEFKGGYPPGALMDPTNAAAATVAVQDYSNLLTRTALTPTITPAPTFTVAPTRTPGVGLIADLDCIPPLHSGMPRFPSCWEARVNQQRVLVGGGSLAGIPRRTCKA